MVNDNSGTGAASVRQLTHGKPAANVHYWPKADVHWCTANVRFQG